jgi:hypothetical protein
MLTGYNTDIKHEGVIYHVQTEDGGSDNPVIVSLIYQGGRILASKKTSYAHLLGTDDLMSQLRDLLEHQHKVMIKAILTGAPVFERKKVPTATPPSQHSPQAPAPTPDQTPSHPPQTPAQGNAEPSATSKPPLEIPPETTAEAPTDLAAEKNLDQVILEYLASEIDKD